MKTSARSIISVLLILLFIYAAVSKLLTFSEFRQQLYNQTFPHQVAGILLYLLPAAELITAALLCGTRSMLAGLAASAALLAAFTAYISLVMLHYWDRVPCSCGGILSHMSWTTHLIFNWVFLILNLIAIYLHLSERRSQPLLTD
jgi:putative oxidoreductase